MLKLREGVQIYLSKEVVDFRKGIDGLIGVVQEDFGKNLNEIYNALLLLIHEELPYWRLNLTIPSATILPPIYSFTEFVSERNRLFDSISEFDDLYLHLVHARKSHEENWAIKLSVELH
ncbi:MAG: hypothetical protein Q8R79_08575 [Legionellaceae bacterium]|nr:hypothetical protein [Legionellaceae bacterium]